MTDNAQDRITHCSELPTVSGPTVPGLARFSTPPPQIEGYEIVGQLGEAGQGRVWRAMQLSTRRQVALKVPRVDLLSSRKALARFEREVELAARLTHPNIARIYDSGIYQGLYYYAMELIEGLPLDGYLEQHKLTQRQTVQLTRTICEAIQHAHQNGVIHRDIKPSNIIVTKDGQPHVVDFGLAMNIFADDAFRTVSIEGEVTGTPAYMSPEQAAGHHEAMDTRTDVYSIGVVFYKALTGNFPYDVKSSMIQTLENIRSAEPTRPSRLLRNLDSDVEAIVLKALAKEPARRYQSAAELRQDIERWLNNQPIMAKADSTLYLLRKILNQHRYTTAVVALLVIITFGYSIFSFQLYDQLRQRNKELEGAHGSLIKESELTTLIAKQQVFTMLLLAWHQNNWDEVQRIASILKGGSREDRAAKFLADKRPMAQKLDELKDQLEKSEPCFLRFIIAEHYLKDGDRQKAIQTYKESLSYQEDLQLDNWLAVRIRGRLYELTEESRPVENSSPAGRISNE